MSEESRRRGVKIEGRLVLLLMVAELLLFILSWLLSATRMEGVRSLLSSEGIRWFFGYFTQMVASPLLVWLLLGLCAYGCLQRSGLLSLLTSHLSLLTSHISRKGCPACLTGVSGHLCGHDSPAHAHAPCHPPLCHRLPFPLGIQSQSGAHHRLRTLSRIHHLRPCLRPSAWP